MPISKAREFLFGQHGVLESNKMSISDFKNFFNSLSSLKKNLNRKMILKIFDDFGVPCKISYVEFVDQKNLEIGLFCKIFDLQIQWIF